MRELNLDDLATLLHIPGPAGDEGAVADWVAEKAARIPGMQLTRIGDNVIAVKNGAGGADNTNNTNPPVAVFAHMDTTGFTLGFRRKLIPIGGPSPRDKNELRCGNLTGRVRVGANRGLNGGPDWALRRVRDANGKRAEPIPGTRWVYAASPKMSKSVVTAPYLDNRAGVWCALRVLQNANRVAVAFSTGEEMHGHGARVCADFLHKTHGVTQALISDLTWHGDDTPCGSGVAVSRRDGTCPRQKFLDRVLDLTRKSGISYQEEIQSAGGSDGSHLLRSAIPMDWVFVGAPEKKPHTNREQAHFSDLNAMTNLLLYLAEHL